MTVPPPRASIPGHRPCIAPAPEWRPRPLRPVFGPGDDKTWSCWTPPAPPVSCLPPKDPPEFPRDMPTPTSTPADGSNIERPLEPPVDFGHGAGSGLDAVREDVVSAAGREFSPADVKRKMVVNFPGQFGVQLPANLFLGELVRRNIKIGRGTRVLIFAVLVIIHRHADFARALQTGLREGHETGAVLANLDVRQRRREGVSQPQTAEGPEGHVGVGGVAVEGAVDGALAVRIAAAVGPLDRKRRLVNGGVPVLETGVIGARLNRRGVAPVADGGGGSLDADEFGEIGQPGRDRTVGADAVKGGLINKIGRAH